MLKYFLGIEVIRSKKRIVLSSLNHQFTQELNLVVECKFNDISPTLPLTCGLEIFERPNKWKSILIGEETTMQGLEHRISLDHPLWYHINSLIHQKLKLVVEGKINYISPTSRMGKFVEEVSWEVCDGVTLSNVVTSWCSWHFLPIILCSSLFL